METIESEPGQQAASGLLIPSLAMSQEEGAGGRGHAEEPGVLLDHKLIPKIYRHDLDWLSYLFITLYLFNLA